MDHRTENKKGIVLSKAKTLVRESCRPSDVVVFEQAVVSFFVDLAEVLGIPRSLAAIYGICFANNQPLSFADIDQRLNLSKGSLSQGIRVLTNMGALLKTSNGLRREYYTPELSMRKLAVRYLEQRIEKMLTADRRQLATIKAHLPLGRDDRAKELCLRVKALDEWCAKSRGIAPAIRAFLWIGK